MIKRFIIKIIAFCLVSINVNAIENVILFGDSLMAGYGLPQEKHLAIVLQNNLNDSGYDLGIIDAVNYEEIKICEPACKCGSELEVPVYVFLKEPLIRKYGEDWYKELLDVAKTISQ